MKATKRQSAMKELVMIQPRALAQLSDTLASTSGNVACSPAADSTSPRAALARRLLCEPLRTIIVPSSIRRNSFTHEQNFDHGDSRLPDIIAFRQHAMALADELFGLHVRQRLRGNHAPPFHPSPRPPFATMPT
ncbi:hypothetical protein COOONC_08661 [Cooperia oncophora]